MGDELLSFADTRFGLLSKVADVRHRVGAVPATPGGEPPKAVRGSPGSLAQDDRVVGDLHIESIPRFDGELPSRRAGNDDLVLSTDLDA
jgi:hypothetical protein